MRTIASRTLTHETASVVRRASRGETLVVTVSGVPKAVIGPYREQASASRLEQLAREGLASAASAPVRPVERVGSLRGRADELLGEDRSDQWA
ncbi:MAG: type II toxin-antitoxin system prevent-host-death family antitoxin [Propionibacteriaceae bacterium]|jgi:prevent-host-death family protein|nr:type II toxin-antitoxin system prevent-host-death family antitoxin [Propionibacteriaceae bacterium]